VCTLILYLALVGSSWGFLLLLYAFVQISRLIVVGVLYPLLRHFGYGLDLKEAMILVWSGLRGAVALSLSLSVKVSQFHLFINKPFSLYFIFM
jgi:NhaP-type Na+/H+ or K+/H+ antiporter